MAGAQRDEVDAGGRNLSLSGAKLRLLNQRMRGVGPQSEQAIHPRDPGAKIPLSAEQRRVWLHALQQPDLPVYNEPSSIYKYGRFDLHILEASFNEILRRHEAWRTSFSPDGDQLVHADVHVSLPLVDISGLPPTDREAEALRIATRDAQAPIPIGAAPLFRAKVVRVSEDEHRLYLTFHHIILDGISISRIFLPELSAIYASLEAGGTSSLPAPPVQYGDYAIWREQHVKSSEVKQHLAYWLDQLSGELPTLRLPEDRARPALTDYRGSTERFRIPASLAESLRQLSRRQGVTLYMTLLAAFNVLLFRYSGQNDFIVGSATDARRRPELENVMGYFIDTFILRTRPTADLTFSAYLFQIRDSVLGGLAAADVPFDQVVKVINPRRDPLRHPIFQVFFAMRPRTPHLAEDWGTAQTDVTVGTSKFDLHLEVGDVPGAMDARFFYRTDIWDTPTIGRMAAHWLVLLESIAQNPDGTLGSLGMLTPAEAALLLEPSGWNDTARPFPQRTPKALFEEQARRTPNSIAAAFGQERWTYQDLNSRADVLASSLRGAGVIRGSVVALVLDRSLDMLASLIAVHKVAAAYLPIDIQLPPAGIEVLLRDATPSAVLTERSLAHLVPSLGTPCLLVDKNTERPNVAAPVQQPSAGNLDDAAYLIYTSGTTGAPKPVEISQRSLVNLLVSMQASPGFSPEDVLLAVTSISFDIAALELFLPLISGSRVVIASRGEAQDPYLLAKAIRRSHCTVMQATPATWRTLLLSGWSDATVSSKDHGSRRLRVLCGGEPLSDDLADRLLATGAELWNMYGPTETTIWSLIHRVQDKAGHEKGPVSVGRPIANTTAFIMDSQGQLLPVGIPGTLFLGGVGLAKGYRGRAQQTDERFVNVHSVGGLRLYNTGDIAVRRADGTIGILGRMDNRVKIRGYRVELEAVEAAILQHPRVVAAAVRAWPEPTGGLRLSAYVVPSDPAAPPAFADIRSFLKRDLPDSMVPSDVIPLSSIPLTSHGKVDRARLPAPAAPEVSPVSLRFRSPAEERLAAIWIDLLGQAVGPEENFFDLGGHSVLMAVLQKRIHKEFGHLIPLAELFHLPTVRQQAELLQESDWHHPALPPGVLLLQPQGSSGRTVFWVHFMNAQLAREFGEGQSFFFVTLTADDVRSLGPSPTLEQVAGFHVRKILATKTQEPYVIGGFCVGSILAYEIATQLKAKGHEVSLLVMLDAPNPSCFPVRSSLPDKLKELRYYIQRSRRIGLQKTWLYFRERVKKRFAPIIRQKADKTELRIAQELIETAAFSYRPRLYDGKVLLLLASEHSPQFDFVPAWQAVIPHDLYVQFLDTHHRDLMKGETVRNVANTIADHLSAHCRECA
jgi:amino acid adenylation domain-containing protein